jgi:hypothetical protein
VHTATDTALGRCSLTRDGLLRSAIMFVAMLKSISTFIAR